MKRSIIAFIMIVSFAGCSSSHIHWDACSRKVARTVAQFLSDSSDVSRLSCIITIDDSTGLRHEFPFLRIANAKIALGHFSKQEIVALCRHEKILFIDTPKTLFPK
ncbi:MAG: hypothetical protein PHP42_01490 [Bacteroidota bacterium]|nr:hypothetical protein [Bacteroidota bacterium]